LAAEGRPLILIQKAQAAVAIIRKDFETWYTVEQLAKLVGLTGQASDHTWLDISTI